MSDVVTARGTVIRVKHAREDSGWRLLTVNVRGQHETWVGVMPAVAPDEAIEATGTYADHDRWGRQFQVTTCMPVIPTTTTGLERYLGNGFLPGIGPTIAKNIVDKFGERTMAILDSDPGRLAEVKGVSEAKAKKLGAAWAEKRAVAVIMAFLQQYGASPSLANRIYATYKERAVEVVQKAPYRLAADVDGIGFKIADTIARSIGITAESEERAQAAVMHTLKEEAKRGHVFTERRDLARLTVDLLVDQEAPEDERAHYAGIVLRGIDTLAGAKRVRQEPLDEEHVAVFSGALYRAEARLAHQLRAILTARPAVVKDAPKLPMEALAEQAIAEFEAEKRMRLAPEQREAVMLCAREKALVVTGGPGCGKTTLLLAILRLFDKAKLDTALAAPTGRAAKRMAETTGKAATTIHRLLEFKPGVGFTRNAEKPLEATAVVVDECFDYKQPILTENGWANIGRIVNSKQDVRVWSRHPETGALELKRIVRWLKRPAPSSTVLRISAGRTDSLRNARIIHCTPDHKVLTPSGYVRAGDLRLREEVIVRGDGISAEQKSIIVGSLLGDGHMSRNIKRGNARHVALKHGEAQREYLEAKRLAFGGLAGPVKTAASGYENGKPVFYFLIKTMDDVSRISKEMPFTGTHPSGRRRWSPTDKLIEWIDPLALAVWYLDNGSTSAVETKSGTSYYATLHSQRFSKDDNERLARHLLNAFDLDARVFPDSHGFYYIRFNKDATAALFDVIRPYVPACMAWKVPGALGYVYGTSESTGTTTAEVRSIDEVPLSKHGPHVYDLEIEDHHNYVAGNIVVSNCSMLDVSLADQLVQAIGLGARVVFVGDVDQLPSVGPGAVLRDIIESGAVPTVRLNRIFRQAEGSLITTNAHRINRGEKPVDAGDPTGEFQVITVADDQSAADAVVDAATRWIPERFGLDPMTQVQVLCPMHKGPAGVGELNKRLQAELNGQGEACGRFRAGDKVMQLKNDYERDVFNGDVGYVVGTNEEDELVVRVDGRDVVYESKHLEQATLAYATTIHRGQGSEYPAVVIPLLRSQYVMLVRNLVYTGVTRGKRLVVLVADQRALATAVRQTKRDIRRTRLAARLGGR